MEVPLYTLRELVAGGSIVFSAGAYLFDFGSNVVVLVQYSTRYVQLSSLIKTQNPLNEATIATLRHQKSELAGYFFALLAILACCHSLNALLFKIKVKATRDNIVLDPVFAAYFLPLIHLYRLANLVWRTFSYQGVRDLTCPLVNGLYCIIGSALEGVPMLVLQFCGFLVLTQEGVFRSSMWTTFKVSVAASLLSAAYNGATSTQSVACTKTSSMKEKVLVATTGGGVTLCATIVRCLTFANIIVHIRRHFIKTRSIQEQAKFHVSDSIPLVVIASCITGYTLFFSLFHNNKSNKGKTLKTRLPTSLVFAYMSMMMGPLYAMVSDAAEGGHLGKCSFLVKLFVVFLAHLSVDIVVVFVTMRLGTLPRLYLVTSLLGILGCVGFLCAFIKVDVWRGSSSTMTHREEAPPSPSPSSMTSVSSWSSSSSSKGKDCEHAMMPELTESGVCTKPCEERMDDKAMDVQATGIPPATFPTIAHREETTSSPSPSPSMGEVCVHIMEPEATRSELSTEHCNEMKDDKKDMDVQRTGMSATVP